MNSFLEINTNNRPIADNILDMNKGPIENKPNIPPNNVIFQNCFLNDSIPPRIVKIEKKNPIDPHIINNSFIDSGDKLSKVYSADIDCNSINIVDSINAKFIDAKPIHIRIEIDPAVINKIPAIKGFDFFFECSL